MAEGPPEFSAMRLKLSAQRALLGYVTPGLRAVSIDYDGTDIIWCCVFDSEASKERGWEEVSCAAAEVIADFPAPTGISEEYLVMPPPLPFKYVEWLVFERWEPSDTDR